MIRPEEYAFLSTRGQAVFWEGVQLAVPPQWDIQSVAPGYIVLGTAAGPAVEFKTGAAGNRPLSRKALFRRLSRQMNGWFRKRLTQIPMASEWERRLEGFSATAFRWREGGRNGNGAILTCKECGRTHMLQFFSPPVDESGPVYHLLDHLRDHQDDGWRPFRLFDIEGAVPPGYETDTCRFEPGRFTVDFAGPEHRIRFFRWSPGDVLLKNRTLEEFLKAQKLLLEETGQPEPPRDRPGEWSETITPPTKRVAIGSSRQRPIHRRCRAVLLRRENRILALLTEGRESTFTDFDRLWETYGTVPENTAAAIPHP
ncbi:MAG: hypothetical protein PVH30_07310 [Desulfobacterales bacterium]